MSKYALIGLVGPSREVRPLIERLQQQGGYGSPSNIPRNLIPTDKGSTGRAINLAVEEGEGGGVSTAELIRQVESAVGDKSRAVDVYLGHRDGLLIDLSELYSCSGDGPAYMFLSDSEWVLRRRKEPAWALQRELDARERDRRNVAIPFEPDRDRWM